MFKFLKEKLKKALSVFSKKVEEEADIKQEVKEVPVEEIKKKEVVSEKKPEIKKEVKPQPKPEIKKEIKPEPKPEIKKEVKPKPEPEVIKEKKKPVMPVIKEVKETIEEELAGIREEEAKKEKEEFILEESPKVEIERIEKKIWEEKKKKEEEKEKEKPKKESFLKKFFAKKEKKEEKKVEEVAEPKPEAKPTVEELATEAPEAPVEEEPEEEPEVKEEVKKETEPELESEEEPEEEPKKRGLFRKIKETFTTVRLSEDKFEKLFWELEVVLLENNVAVEVIDKIKADLKADLTTGKISRKNIYDLIGESLRKSVEDLFMDQDFSLVQQIKKKKEKPYIIAFIGVNGSGKTTTMAKVAYMLLKNKLSVVFAASDTFRAAAIQQLQEHANRLGVKMIRHDYESDPAAVAFDAVKHAKAKSIDVVMIDTAGRLHSNDNLMNELKKLVRVNNPDLKIFVGESITGNDCVEQAKLFNESVGIDVIILAKADVDEKGGAAVSVSYVTKKPIIYLGTGQKYEDLTEFKPEIIIKNIGL